MNRFRCGCPRSSENTRFEAGYAVCRTCRNRRAREKWRRMSALLEGAKQHEHG